MNQAARHASLRFEKDRDGSEKELGLARHVMGNLVRGIQADPNLFQYWLLPAAEFSGDVIAARMTEGGRFHVLLADGTGHGLAAALCVMPVSEIFYAMTSKGFSIGSIARELNKKMHALLPRDRFVAATLASLTPANRTLEIWNGGGPAALFVSEDGRCLRRWASSHLPIGVLPDEKFDERTAYFQWDKPGQLYLYSDGLMDARDEEDRLFGAKKLEQSLLNVEAPHRFRHLKEAVMKHIGSGETDDDISLVSIHCRMGLRPPLPFEAPPNASAPSGPHHWKVTLYLSAADIKNIDVLPVLLTWLKQTGLGSRDTQCLFLILTELYTNAVDHGLLALDSALKSSSSGFEGYLKQRARRLHDLEEGQVDILMERTLVSGQGVIKIRVEDSGKGFDSQAYPKAQDWRGPVPSGKGITLVHSLSSKMTYLNQGSSVEVEYPLSRS